MKRKHFGIVAFIVGILLVSFAQETFAVGSNLVISEVKTGGMSDPKQFVEIYNDDSQPVDLTNFTLEYAKSSADIDGGCNAAVWQDLTKKSNVSAHSLSSLVDPVLPSHASTTVELSMNDNTGGAVRLTQTTSGATAVYDLVGWGDDRSPAPCVEGTQAPVIANNKSLERFFNTTGHPIDTDNNSVDFVLSYTPSPGVSSAPTPGMGSGMATLCDNQVRLSEFLTDPVGLEADGGEFIELYNADSSDASLLGCHLQSSNSSSDLVTFLSTDIVPAQGYFVVPLTNKLINKQGYISFETANQKEIVNYLNLGEGQSNSLIDGKWQITDQPTPNIVNQLVVLTDEEAEAETVLAPCPSGKYRNPATNRCKNIASSTSSLKACAADQYRNPETGRCKKLGATTSTLKPCAANQVRSPETNRCRLSSVSTSKLTPCKVGYERNPETNRCRKVSTSSAQFNSFKQPASTATDISPRVMFIATVFATGYALYEYRDEARRGLVWVKAVVKNSLNLP